MRKRIHNICIVLVCVILSVGCNVEKSQTASFSNESTKSVIIKTEQRMWQFLEEYEKKNEEIVMSLNSMPTFEEVENLKACIKRVWVVDGVENEDTYYGPFSFCITSMQHGIIEGEYRYNGIATWEFDEKDGKGKFTGRIRNGRVECSFQNKEENEVNLILTSWEDMQIEAEVGCIRNDGRWQYSRENRETYRFRPYNLSDVENITVLDEHSFEMELDSWGHIRFVAARADNIGLGRYYPATYLTDIEGNILYEFGSTEYTAGEEIYDIVIEDINGDGLKDIGVITWFSFMYENGEKNFTRWDFCQKQDGTFYLNHSYSVNLDKTEDSPIPSNDEIKRYLNMTEEELENMTGAKIEKLQSLLVFETTLPFPVLFPENTSYWFVCTSWDTTCKPKYLSYNSDYEKEYLKQLGLENAVDFNDIMEVMGSAEIEASRTREEMEEIHITDYKNYKIEYEQDGLQYVFIADNLEGKNFTLYIGLAI